MPTVGDIASFLESFAPVGRAADWDNVGLILGARSPHVHRVLTCLTVTPEVVAEAIETKTNLIVTHHPMLFRPIQKLTDATVEGRMVLALLEAAIAVYSPHTAFDNCAGGINDLLAQRLGLVDVSSLRPFPGPKLCKLVVFVPDSDLSKVCDTIFAAGAGQMGQYSQCSFRVAGTGTFFGSETANPTIGSRGRREEVSEWRLEAVCSETVVDDVIAAMRKAHSYEEPAFDVVPLRPTGEAIGEGRIGRLKQPVSLGEIAKQVRSALGCGPIQVVGDPGRNVQRAAVACGAAGEFLNDAIRLGADAFLTGEARFHDCLAAKSAGIGMVLPGHYASERLAAEALAGVIRKQWPDLAASPSQSETDPVQWF